MSTRFLAKMDQNFCYGASSTLCAGFEIGMSDTILRFSTCTGTIMRMSFCKSINVEGYGQINDTNKQKLCFDPNKNWAKQNRVHSCHDDVIKRKHFLRYRPFVHGIYRSSVNSPQKGQWRGALIFSSICAWTNGWGNNRDTGKLRCHHADHDVTVMVMGYTAHNKRFPV